ncbi:hypothetical protein ACGFJT_37205 [Actinomadura geliboluensis]|uniref:hypothetical protein n=1 Tax=Actinomadura geliboluensis TaxID=882440 RepID=UPI00371C50DA
MNSRTTRDFQQVNSDQELTALVDKMLDVGLTHAEHYRAAELILGTQRSRATARVHAILASGNTNDTARLEADLAAALTALKAADADNAATARDLDQARAEKTQVALDGIRYRTQANAVVELCQTLREEGHLGFARRIESVIEEADIAVAKQRAAYLRIRETAERLIGQQIRIRRACGSGKVELWRLLEVKGDALWVVTPSGGQDHIPLNEVAEVESLTTADTPQAGQTT